MSGLKVNFQKSNLYGINIDQQILEGWVDSISCKTENLPSTYLSLSLGVGSNSLEIWKSIFSKFEKRLARLKSLYLSMRDRVTMLKFVLASLPVYYLSMFQTPTIIIDEVDRIQMRFLWCRHHVTSRLGG